MSCALLLYVSIATVLLHFTIEIECCSLTTNEVINLMSYNEHYKQDPCYIQWQAEQDAKLAGIWKQREELERRMHDYNERMRENERIERENRQRSYISTTVPRKESGVWKILGICVGAVVGICCCVACVAVLQGNDNDASINGAVTVPFIASPQFQTTSVASSNHMGNQSTFTPNANNNDLAALPLRRYSRSDLPLTPIRPIRQDSLPSYDIANNNDLAALPLRLDSRSDLPPTPIRPIRQDSLPSYDVAVKMTRPVD